jgi:hypothetical protein
MTDAYREDWDITSEEGSLCFASAIYSRMVGGEQDEATLQWLAKYLRANAPPRHHTAMTDQHYDLMPAMNDQLRTRVEAMEARYETQRQATLEWGKDVLRRIMALEEAGSFAPPPAVDRERDLQDQIRDGSLTLAEALDLGVLPASDVQDAMRRAASKAMSEVALEMGGFGKNYTYRAPAAPAPTDSYCDIWHRFQLEEGQKPSLSTSLHSYSVGEAKPPEDCGKVKVLPDLSQRIIGSLEWTQQEQEQELDSVFADRQIVAVPAHRGGQSIRFKVFADDPGLSDYGSGKLLALSKVVFKVLSNNMLESGIIEVTAISVGLVADMLDQQAEYAAQQMDQAAPSPSPAPTDSLVERVARRLARFVCEGLPGDDATPIASAVLCDVAAWILEQAPAPGPLVVMADMLRSEANQ